MRKKKFVVAILHGRSTRYLREDSTAKKATSSKIQNARVMSEQDALDMVTGGLALADGICEELLGKDLVPNDCLLTMVEVFELKID